MESLQIRVRLERLTPCHLLGEVYVLEQDKVRDDGLSTSQELSSVAEQTSKLVEAVQSRIPHTFQVVARSEAHLSVVNDNFVTDALQLIRPCTFSWCRS